MNDTVAGILDRLSGVHSSGAGWAAKCPAHEDHVASLSIGEGESADAVVHCHAGCQPSAVMEAVGLSVRDLAGAPRVVATYPYHDADGTVLYTVERWSPKTFRVRPGLPDVAQRVLFGRQWIDYARSTGAVIYVVEGEKDALALINAGIPATCNVGGAGVGKWLPHYSDQLAGCAVVVIADDDDPGRTHARAVAASLAATAKSVTLALPGYGKDVAELLDAGYTIEHLRPLPAAESLPVLLAATVPVRRLRWAWQRYIPQGKLTTLEGDPGVSKSTLSIDLVARWSSGMAMPDGVAHDGPWPCLMISAEDDPEDTIVPRLMAAGADIRRVHLLSSGVSPDSPFNLADDFEGLEQTIAKLGIRILTLDPLSAFLPSTSDSHSDADIRRALYPLHLLARRMDVAVIAVRHLSKSATKAIHAGNGSIGIIAAARAAFMVGSLPDQPEVRVLAPIKCNLAAPPPTLQYRIEIDPRHDVGRLSWGGELETSAQDVLDGDKGQDERLKRDAAREYLAELCTAPMAWKEISARGKLDGFAEITMRRVRDTALVNRINPIAANGDRLTGTYWIRADLVDTLSSAEVMHAHINTHAGPHNLLSKASEQATVSDAESPELNASVEDDIYTRERVCDACGSDDARIFDKPHFVIRCRAHDPRRWTAP